MDLYTFNGPQITRKSFINLMPNEFNPPYIRPHFVFKMHWMTYPGQCYSGRVTSCIINDVAKGGNEEGTAIKCMHGTHIGKQMGAGGRA